MTRINYIDNMKAMGIILVVLGHAAWLNEDIYTLIYSFHMPLFFFLSGYLASNKPATKQSLLKLFQRLILPFIFFFLISFLFWLPLHFFGSGQASNMQWFDPLSRVVTSKADSFHINGVLWFFPCLIVISYVQIIFFSVLKPLHSLTLSSAMLTMMLINSDLISQRLFWSIDSAAIGLFFYQLGILLKSTGFFNNALFNNKTKNYLLLLLITPIFYYLAVLNENVDMRELQFGVFPILYPIVACLGILTLFLASKIIKPRVIFQLLAMSSIVIFPLHLIVFRFFHKAELVLIPSNSLIFGFLPYFNTLLAIIVCFFIYKLLKSKLPKAIGL